MNAGDQPRLLYLTRTFPYFPATGGDMVYSAGVIESLAKVADLTVLSGGNGAVPNGVRNDHGCTWQIVRGRRSPAALSFLSPMPNILWRFATRQFHAALAELLKQRWDGIILDQLGMAHVLPVLAARTGALPPIVYLSHEYEASARAEKYATYGGGALKQALLRLDGRKVARWEQRMVAASDIISVINPNEAPLYAEQAPDTPYVVTTPGFVGTIVRERTIDQDVPRRVALLGGRGSKQKQVILVRWLEASAQIFHDAGIEMEVIGAISDDLRGTVETRFPTVKVTGFVEDLAAHLQSCRLGLVPDFVGRGVKLRLLDLIFARVPLFGLAGAIDGLPLAAGSDYREAPDMAALAKLVIAQIDDFARLNALQEAAFQSCSGKFDWQDRGRGLVEAIAKLQRQATGDAE